MAVIPPKGTKANRTPSGAPSAVARQKYGVNDQGDFPIFDKASAEAALKLRGKAKTKAERQLIIERAMKYAPDMAKQAYMADKKAGAI